jgi:hypothetical protein
MPPRKPAKGVARERKPAMKRGGRVASKAPGAGGAPAGGGGGRTKKAKAGALRKAKIPKGDAAAHKQQSYYDVDDEDEDYAGRTKAEDDAFGEGKTEFEDLPSDFEDEEIDEDEAFTEEDKRRYGDVNWDSFASGKKKGKKGGDVDFSDEDFDDDEDVDRRVEDDEALGNDEPDENDEEEELMLDSDEDDEAEAEDDAAAAAAEDEDVEDEDIEDDVSDEDGSDEDGSDEDGSDLDKTDALLDDVVGDVRAARVAREAATRGRRLRRGLTEAMPESEFGTAPSAGTSGGDVPGATGRGALSVASLVAASLGGGAGGADDAEDAENPNASVRRSNPLAGARRRLDRLASSALVPAAAPLPRTVSERVERKAAYVATGEAVSLWQDTVKANRERPTLKFTDAERDKAPRIKTLASMNAGFDPGGDGASDFERAIMAKIKESATESGRDVERAEELQLNALSAEEAGERRARLAKMRNLLFRHELKAKRVKAIKSKTFARHNRKTGAVRMIDGDDDDDALAGLESADSAEARREYLRAQERMLLKHKNTSRWAKRAIRKGLAHLPGTKEAIAEQLRIGQELKRKIGVGGEGLDASADDANAESETDASDASDDNDDDESGGRGSGALADAVAERQRLARAKTKTLRMLQDGEKTLENASGPEEEGGLFALPFMAKALRKKREAAENEARALLEDIERAEAEARRGDADDGGDSGDEPRQQEHGNAAGVQDATWGPASRSFRADKGEDASVATNARRTFGGAKPTRSGAGVSSGRGAEATRAREASEEADKQSDKHSEARDDTVKDDETDAGDQPETKRRRGAARAAARAAAAGASGAAEAPSFAASGGGVSAAANPGAAFRELPRGAGAAKARHAARQGGRAGVVDIGANAIGADPESLANERTGPNEHSDGGEGSYDGGEGSDDERAESQRALLARAFAGDDVVAAFDAEKAAEVEAELPKTETPKRMPGWGGWAEEQAKRPPPKWQVEAEKAAAREKAKALKARADAKLARVVISERFDKKAARFNVEHLPHGFESKAVYEGSMRAPLGGDVNTDKSFRDLTRPKVLKNAGAVIRPPTLPKTRKRKKATNV